MPTMTEDPQTKAITLTGEQQCAVDRIFAWMNSGTTDDFTLGGYAGTGKTTLVNAILANVPEWVAAAVLTPTGKAAQVLRNKGVPEADTIHSFVYDYRGKTKEKNDRGEVLKEHLKFEPKMRTDLFAGDPRPCDDADLIIVDESSMVNGKLYDDIHALGLPTLWVGDHGQLPPIGEDPGLMRSPMATLETIHRQAAGNPILEIAHRVRRGASPRSCTDLSDGKALKIGARASESRMVQYCIDEQVDLIVVPFNKIRHSMNKIYREKLGYSDRLVCVGDRLICTLNNRRKGIFNGMLFDVIEIVDEEEDSIVAVLASADDENLAITLRLNRDLLKYYFDGGQRKPDLPESDDGALCQFEYGYAITVHKAQGSEAPHVFVVDRECKHWSMDRWRYTGYTRGKDRLTISV